MAGGKIPTLNDVYQAYQRGYDDALATENVTELARLRAECERLRTALTATQWSTGHGLYSCCPQCHGLEPPGSKYPSLDGSAGHSPDCPIAAALKDEP